MHGIAALTLLLALARPPCLPDELGAGAAAPAPVEPSPRPPPPAPPKAPPPPVAQSESARYRIDYGPLSVGELRVAIGGAAPGSTLVRAGGRGSGAVLGLGRMSNSIATQFDLQRLDSRRWVNARQNDDRSLTDHAEQPEPGHVTGVRKRLLPHPGSAPMQATLAGPLLDPLGFLLRLRVELPSPGGAAQVLYVLDGQALWRVTVKNAGRAPLPEGTVRVPTLRLDAEAEPVTWGGASDVGERHHRSFALWLSDDANRVPLRLEMPLGPSSVVVALTELRRSPAVP